tara:strand:- start:818 stop:1162 length:345 start_codon:yes stop_codon:yes gene_type:complete
MNCPDCDRMLIKANQCKSCGWRGEAITPTLSCKYCGSMRSLGRSKTGGMCCVECYKLPQPDERSWYDDIRDEMLEKSLKRDDSVGSAFRVMVDKNLTEAERKEGFDLIMKNKLI